MWPARPGGAFDSLPSETWTHLRSRRESLRFLEEAKGYGRGIGPDESPDVVEMLRVVECLPAEDVELPRHLARFRLADTQGCAMIDPLSRGCLAGLDVVPRPRADVESWDVGHRVERVLVGRPARDGQAADGDKHVIAPIGVAGDESEGVVGDVARTVVEVRGVGDGRGRRGEIKGEERVDEDPVARLGPSGLGVGVDVAAVPPSRLR